MQPASKKPFSLEHRHGRFVIVDADGTPVCIMGGTSDIAAQVPDRQRRAEQDAHALLAGINFTTHGLAAVVAVGRVAETAFNLADSYWKDLENTRSALRDLVRRCDGEEGVRPDGSNIDTRAAHAALDYGDALGDTNG